MDDFFERILIFQIVLEAIQVLFGAGLCFGALKWRRGSLTFAAVVWGAVLGISAGLSIGGDIETALIGGGIGILLFPILTYTIPGVNRLVLGFLIGTKFIALITTVLFKEGAIDAEVALIAPLLAGALIGIIFMAWTRMRVLPFVLGCTFVGASDIAPIIAEWYNRLAYGITGDISFLFDPMDLLFALFKIELTDTVTLIAVSVMLIIGCASQLKRLKGLGIPYSTPIIGFEVPREENGKIIM